jgi:hypothetical protein
MKEVAHLMYEARGRLSQGLAAVQIPGAPVDVASSAAPLAHAIGLLDQLERGAFANLNDAYPHLLSMLQQILHQLQWSSQEHPAVARAMDHVAGALGLVFTVRSQPSAVAEPEVRPRRSAEPIPRTQPSLGMAAPASAAEAPLVERAVAAAKQRPVPRPEPRPAAAVPKNEPENAEPDPPSARQRAEQKKDLETLGAASTDAAGLLRVDASLAANSSSNFYRGFDGDDVLEHGGLFVATYSLPELDQRVAVRVSFPDGREFLARGVVKWRRLAPPGGSHAPEAPPGFGLKFEQVPAGARQLVESYVKNREPLFHDHD